jgi:hypothetical protein
MTSVTAGSPNFCRTFSEILNPYSKKIVFLSSLFDKQQGGWFFSELENSSRPASKAIIKKMRKIKARTGGA